MRRRVVIGIMIVICLILQTAVFPMIPILAAVPNLLLVLTVSVAFMQGCEEGALTGFLCGLLMDLSAMDTLGIYALLFVIAGFCSGIFAERYFDEDIKMPLLLVLASDLAINIVIYIGGFLLKGRTNLGGYLRSVILPEAVSTVIMLLILYRLIYRINHALKEKEKKSRYSLWIRD